MIQIPIDTIPNQNLTVNLDDSRYDITILEANNCMIATILRDDETIVESSRLVAGEPIIPYRYREQGNFTILSETDDLPYWENFGVTQTLVFLTQSELDTLRE